MSAPHYVGFERPDGRYPIYSGDGRQIAVAESKEDADLIVSALAFDMLDYSIDSIVMQLERVQKNIRDLKEGITLQ